MLTAGDQSFLQAVTGESFDPGTISAEQAAGTFKGNTLAAAIGYDRAIGELTGSISETYLDSIQSELSLPNNTNGYECRFERYLA